MDEVGIKNLGVKNEKHRQKLLARGQSVKLIPKYYTLNQEVKLFNVVNNHSQLADGFSGRIMPPHHRKGHYRRQRYGVGNNLTKRIRILPVFVNSHLFLGDMLDAKTTYK